MGAQTWLEIDAAQGTVFNSQNLIANLIQTDIDEWSLSYEGVPALANIPVMTTTGNTPQSVSGSFTIDQRQGEIQRFALTGNATLTGITNWVPIGQTGGGQFSRLVIDISNSIGGTFTWPSAILWAGGTVPVVSHTRDVIYILIGN